MMDKYMDLAIDEANIAFECDEVPVGVVIVKGGKVLTKQHNTSYKTNCAINHAEILAIKEASKKLNDWRLSDCEMYVTLEPCPMCAGAILQSRIKKVYIGTYSNIRANREILANIFENADFYHKVEYEYMNNLKCSEILTNFFVKKR